MEGLSSRYLMTAQERRSLVCSRSPVGAEGVSRAGVIPTNLPRHREGSGARNPPGAWGGTQGHLLPSHTCCSNPGQQQNVGVRPSVRHRDPDILQAHGTSSS